MSKKESKVVNIPVLGNLGLLAYGDQGLVAWRKVRDEALAKKKKENKENSDKDENSKIDE